VDRHAAATIRCPCVAGESKHTRGAPLPEGLREAVERTYAATAGSAADTRERAAELLDEVIRRGAEAADAVEGASRDAAESAVRNLRRELKSIERRLESMEKKLNPKAKG
jgi:polyhydroxyalkanoate synthesis regulator phasin